MDKAGIKIQDRKLHRKPAMKSKKPLKQKPCRYSKCRKHFTPKRFLQKTCNNIKCALGYAEEQRIKQERKALRLDTKRRREKMKTITDWLKETQIEFNKFIRIRDRPEPCISCGRHHHGQYHAGHYRSIKAAPELRFDENNCNKQCHPCNTHLSGNIVEYRINLVKKIGRKKVESLEGPHAPKRYRIEDLIQIKKHYRQKIKEII